MTRPTLAARRTGLRLSLLAAAGVLAASMAGVVPTARSATAPGASDIFLVGPNGTGLRQLTHADEDLRFESPAWSRNGRWIAYSAPPCDDCPEALFLIDLARGGRITQVPRTPPGAARPSWGPSDGVLTFVGGLTNDVFTIGRGGAGLRRLTNGRVAHDQSAFSRDGRRIAFTNQQPNGHWDIYVMRRDGSAKRPLTLTAVSEEQPAWSHDGRRIAFARQLGGKWAIFTVGTNGGRARRLTPLADNSQQPAWSPDDRRIAYTRITSRGSTVIVMNADGTGRRTIRTGTGRASGPSWSPDGKRIAFTRF